MEVQWRDGSADVLWGSRTGARRPCFVVLDVGRCVSAADDIHFRRDDSTAGMVQAQAPVCRTGMAAWPTMSGTGCAQWSLAID